MKKRKKELSKTCNLAVVNPELAKEWHPTKNGELTPRDVTPGSGKKVWWRCKKGHEWQVRVYYRNQGYDCPYCRTLAVLNPSLAREWHPTKNGKLTPKDVKPYSNKKVWWKCSKGHVWLTVIFNRTKGYNCPYCTGRRVSKDNCLATRRPDIAKEWHPTKNGRLTPRDVTPGSGKKVWWRCKKGHEWEAKVKNRTTVGTGCPYCAGRGKRRVYEETCLATRRPDIAKEWHPTKNGKLTPRDVTPGSGKKVWWRCKKGHEWKAKITNRTTLGTGCPYCAGQRASEDNNLAVVNPRLAKEWHPTKNGELTPRDVTPGSGKKVWWRCKKGHEWKATVHRRNAGRKKCSICKSLAVLRPDLAREWHPTKNGKLTPKDVTLGSGKKVWWRCKKRHKWQMRVISRVNGIDCPYCWKKLRKGLSNLSQVFSPKQKKLFIKKLRDDKLTKTEKNYFSKVVKKKVLALANPELYRLSQQILK